MSYLFIHIEDEQQLKSETLDIIHNYNTIHCFHSQHKNIYIPHKNVSVYCFNIEQIQYCIQNDYQYHLCFEGEKILNSDLFKYYKEGVEIFWFPQLEDFTENKKHNYAKFFNYLNLPICISISNIFNHHCVNEQNRLWITEIYQLFKNPLFNREKELIENEKYNLKNQYLYQQDNIITIKNLVLGYMGDHIIQNDKLSFMDNTKTIFRTPDCSDCCYQQNCIDRGIGFIIKENKYQACCSIEIFNKH